MTYLSQQTAETIKALQHCHALCAGMAMTHCLEKGGDHARPRHLRLMLDCAALCAFTADAMGRKSQFQHRFAGLCAEVCETCAQDCEAVGEMEDCVRACRDCASRCRQMARPQKQEILDMAAQLPPGA